MPRAIFFDVGETILDETRAWGEWADWLGVPRLTFFAVLGQTIERREHHRLVFETFRPGFDARREMTLRRRMGYVERYERSDLYPDAVPCLETLRARGLWIGIAGNQPRWAETSLRALGLPADLIATSASFGVEKPSPEFFLRAIREAGVPAGEVAYVGDRLDNDVLPAIAAGMTGIFLARGPWGFSHARWPEAARAGARIDSLALLPAALDRL